MRITAMDKIEPPYEDVDEINIPFPEKKYKKLLKICNLTEESKLGPHQMNQIFVNAVHHFLKGHLTQDDLSAISDKLWNKIKGPGTEKFTGIGSALYAAAELAYYSRRIYNPKSEASGRSYISFMNEVMEHYADNKSVVVKSS